MSWVLENNFFMLIGSIGWKVFQETTTLYFTFELTKISNCRQIKAFSQEGFASLCYSSFIFKSDDFVELCMVYNGTRKEALSFFCFLKTSEFNNNHFNILYFSFSKRAWLEGC